MTTAAAVPAPPVYRMGRYPGQESELTMTARCMDGGCAWESEPTPQPGTRAVGCESHTAATGHITFAVRLEYIALVTTEAAGGEGSG
ncbi:hypothetical protein OG357_04810 [Streptomyces sp. NBC_01255]|uniref:hypothetical protein n=1 Tax=Streptomyces sp. NBC_01255 TaxID=2903798 RepID=UPI002E37B91D|nr:hypothetical protein [Streptomyces sp. NBC_01255]